MGNYFKDVKKGDSQKERYNPMKPMKERNDEIYHYYMTHDVTYRELMQRYNISYSHVKTLICRRGGSKRKRNLE